MAINLKELPWYYQIVGALLLTLVLIGLGEYLPVSPIQSLSAQREQKEAELRKLTDEVAQLKVIEQKHRQFRADTEALEKQLANLKQIVPEEKAADEFIRVLQESAMNSGISIRHFTAKPVASRDFYSEMPFELQLDGAYYSVLTFFDHLGKLSRIVNVSDLKLEALASAKSRKNYSYGPNTSVSGSCTATTFFTKSVTEMMSEQEVKAAKPGAPAAPGTRR